MFRQPNFFRVQISFLFLSSPGRLKSWVHFLRYKLILVPLSFFFHPTIWPNKNQCFVFPFFYVWLLEDVLRDKMDKMVSLFSKIFEFKIKNTDRIWVKKLNTFSSRISNLRIICQVFFECLQNICYTISNWWRVQHLFYFCQMFLHALMYCQRQYKDHF